MWDFLLIQPTDGQAGSTVKGKHSRRPPPFTRRLLISLITQEAEGTIFCSRLFVNTFVPWESTSDLIAARPRFPTSINASNYSVSKSPSLSRSVSAIAMQEII